MAWNGSGLFQRIHDWTTDAGNGVDIEASRMDAEDDSFASGLNNCVTKDGQNAATADLPMGGFKHTNVANGSASNQYAALGQVQSGAALLVGSVSGTDTITGSLSPAITAYAAGQSFAFIPAGDNTGATTININGLGAKNIFSQGAACVGGEIKSGVPCQIIDDGTQFNILSPYNYCALTGTQTISGDKTFTGTVTLPNDAVTAANLANSVSPRVLIADSGAISSASTVDFDDVFTTTYDVYEVEISNIVPGTDNVNFYLRLGNGSTYESGASAYAWVISGHTIAGSPSWGSTGDVSDSEIHLNTTTLGTGTGEHYNATLVLRSPENASYRTMIDGRAIYFSSDPSSLTSLITGVTDAAEATASIQFLMSSGNIASGRIRIYGLTNGSV